MKSIIVVDDASAVPPMQGPRVKTQGLPGSRTPGCCHSGSDPGVHSPDPPRYSRWSPVPYLKQMPLDEALTHKWRWSSSGPGPFRTLDKWIHTSSRSFQNLERGHRVRVTMMTLNTTMVPCSTLASQPRKVQARPFVPVRTGALRWLQGQVKRAVHP